MKITALAPWFGSKRILAPAIVRELGPHSCYWEPFCGSMAVLLAKPQCSQETVNDLHGDIINLALVIQHDRWGPWLYRKLRRTLVHEEMHLLAKFQCTEPLLWPNRCNPLGRTEEENARRAYWFFVASWLGRNGTIGTKENKCNFCRRFTTNGGDPGTRFASAVDSIPAWRRRIRHVIILAAHGLDLLERIEDKRGVAIYVDPPYIEKGATYTHEFTAEDHVRLAQSLARFRQARVVVSYYDHPDLDGMYPGWEKISCSITKSLANQGQRGRKGGEKIIAPEVLLLNGPSLGEHERKGWF